MAPKSLLSRFRHRATVAQARRAAAASGVEIVAESVCKSFGDNEVLRGIDLEIRAGDLVAIVGLSGSGKTVLLHCLIGLLPCSAGRVLAADHSQAEAPLVDLSTLSGTAMDRVRLAWSFVFQRNALFPGTVLENCALWLQEHTELDEEQIEHRVRDALRAVALDEDKVLYRRSQALSGGMAKRVAVARAVVSDPIVLCYDEPTTGLDPVNAAHVHDLVWDMHFRARADGIARTTVLVTHDRDLLRRLHPRVIMLHEARVGFDGPYDAFVASPLPFVREYLASMPALHRRPAA
jgi:phospholipid/cholesterol/gamma-HCH transport system ATP-binding protein